MQTEQWTILNRIFHAALELPPEARRQFVIAECADDGDLQMRVESLLQAEEQAGSWLLSPVVPRGAASSFAAVLGRASEAEVIADGDILCGRFHVRRRIASGGMGTVFEAWDSDLDTAVAIKVIRPEIAHDSEVVDRFRREVALARRITSPSVCRTFDLERTVHRDRPTVFLTMEFLPGETLAARLRTGPFSSEQALAVAVSVASALDAAHALGIVHRDIKPGNIMLVPRGDAGERAVVTDFGLARLQPMEFHSDAADDGLTRSRLPMGTLSYMAPEQLEGAAVTPATDIYALALVLVEMLSGRRLFAGNNPLSGLLERCTRPVRLAGVLPTEVPAAWTGVLERALSPRTQERPQSASALTDELRAMVAPSRSVVWLRKAKRAVSPRTRNALPRWLAPVAMLFFAALMALSVFLYRSLKAGRDAALQQGATVYLTPTNNSTGQREFDYAGLLLRTQVSQSPHIRLLGNDRVDAVSAAMKRPAGTSPDAAAARGIALRAGAVRVIFSSVVRQGNGYVLQVAIEQPDNNPSRYRARWNRDFPWRASTGSAALNPDMLTALRDAGDWVRQKTGESSADIARLNVPPEDATTDNWKALEEYAHADEMLHSGRVEDGITALQGATRLDPQFALAFARLGDVLFSRDRWTEGLRAYREAISSTGRERLTRREMDRVRGIYANDTRDYATAEAQFRDMASFYPDDWLAWFYRGTPLMRLGRMPEAMAVLQRARELAPVRFSATATMAQFALQAGDTATARQLTAELRKDGFSGPADWIEGEAAVFAADPAAAERHFVAATESGQTSPGVAGGLQLQLRLRAEQGRFADGVALADKALPLAAAEGDAGLRASLLMDRAWLKCAGGDVKECLSDAEASLRMDNTSHRMRVADLLAERFGPAASVEDKAAFERMLSMGKAAGADEIGPLFDVARLQTAATIDLLHRRCASAVKNLRAAAAVDAPVESRQYLAEGLELCARSQTSAAAAAAMKQEAATAYAVVAFSPALCWNIPRLHPPATFADHLAGWLRTTSDRGPRYAAARSSLERLSPRTPPAGATTVASQTYTH